MGHSATWLIHTVSKHEVTALASGFREPWAELRIKVECLFAAIGFLLPTVVPNTFTLITKWEERMVVPIIH